MKGPDAGAGIDRELAHLSPAARWREWLARIEAVLFASAGPVPRARLVRVVGQGAVLGDLRAELAGGPCKVVAVGNGWMLRTRPAYGAVVRSAAELPAGPSGQEGPPGLREFAVLAAIATRQPVTRAELARLFGRRIAPEVLGRLKPRDLIAPGPRSPTPGAPQTLVTTQAFLAMFGLRSLGEGGE